MIENLIFDLDGTIVNSYPHFIESFIAACKKNNIDVPEDRNTVYRLLKITVPDAYRILGGEEKVDYDKFYEDYVETYSKDYRNQPGFAQTIELIQNAKKAGKKNYIYTHTGPVAKEVLANIGICLVAVAKCLLPHPPRPPLAHTQSSQSDISLSIFPLASSLITVPFGTLIMISSPFFP